ncbi:MAG: DUF3786 domain-containing protein [Lachnospiraceae bacterium]|nr:DUF3786 domain-containing protein [Lachnospiraceae bacterium]
MNLDYEKDNKERVPFEHYKAEYMDKDPLEISSRTGFPYSEETRSFTVWFMGKEYYVTHPEFEVSRTEQDDFWCPLLELPAAKILVIRFLNEGAQADATGKFLTYREVPWGEVYYRQFNGRCMMRLAFSYGNRQDAFESAMEKLNGVKVRAGDTGYQVEVFRGFYVRFLLWAGDDEFPPSSQILFSDNFPAVFHAEDLVVVCDIILNTLKKM